MGESRQLRHVSANLACFREHRLLRDRYGGGMILEHAILPVRPGREEEFEVAFAEAKPIIASMPGFIDLTLSRSIETPGEYLLLVHWESVEAHERGFRGSPEYERWRALLHGFYEPFPVVEHFAEVARA